ncbi:two-component system sensor histidine kinase NtrB [Ovoidimarina sediminis]|uniref:two-component system sensor histidine kinase NtrB n=1 Tax=Ovoidimarina sediminis TaxID=3079856 RepID=UPI00290857B1|nr:PAS domain S-box protein [Rhodophyticola sp. MJ-SS7]MDU8943746.1 PAS domain S-box protein [Rhodophyticola sp. MJ-SS7]
MKPRAVEDTSLLELIIETAPDAIITADAEGRILSFSPAAERIFGFSEAEVAGQNLTCLMPEPYRSEHDAYMEHYLETGEKRIIGIGREVRARRKSGEIFVAELAVGELKFGDRHVFTGFIRDASGRARAESRARDLQMRLERVARIQMLGEVSAAMAHEINQPLAAISNFAKAATRALGADAPDLEAIGSHVAAIAEQSIRAGEIIRRMRQMVDRGAAEIRPEDINEIISDAVRVGRMTSMHGEPEVHLDLGQELPKVMADSVQIQQVLLNLMWNAFEAVSGEDNGITIESRMGRETNRIVLRAGVTDDEIVTLVIDSGPGIPENVIGTLFEPLVTTKARGLGIGLAVCRSIIAAHGGRIWAENTDNGAVFCFTLPIAREDAV